jgi:hypothetical protein
MSIFQHFQRIVADFCKKSFERKTQQNYKNRDELFFLQMNSFCFKIFIEFNIFFLVQMIFFITTNAFINERTRDFIVQERRRHIRKRHVLRRHILQKHRERSRIKHERLIWLKITKRHLRRIKLIRFKMISIVREKHTID